MIPAKTEAFMIFFITRFEPVSMIFYIFFSWVTNPLMAASFQSAYYKRKKELGEEILDYTDPPYLFTGTQSSSGESL